MLVQAKPFWALLLVVIVMLPYAPSGVSLTDNVAQPKHVAPAMMRQSERSTLGKMGLMSTTTTNVSHRSASLITAMTRVETDGPTSRTVTLIGLLKVNSSSSHDLGSNASPTPCRESRVDFGRLVT